nr:MAG: replication polyprotein [Chemarfal virus 119]
MEDKKPRTSRWQFTAYEDQYPLIESRHDLIAEIGWQDEICPDTGRKHRQGYLRTHRQCRLAQLVSIIPGVHLEKARDWEALKNYCSKLETRDPSGCQVQRSYERPLRLHEMLIEVARQYLFEKQTSMWSEEWLSRLDRQTDRRLLIKALYIYAKQLCTNHPEYAIVISRQDAKDAWCNFFDLWIEKAEVDCQ